MDFSTMDFGQLDPIQKHLSPPIRHGILSRQEHIDNGPIDHGLQNHKHETTDQSCEQLT